MLHRDFAADSQSGEVGSLEDVRGHGYSEVGRPVEMTLEWSSQTNITDFKYNVRQNVYTLGQAN